MTSQRSYRRSMTHEQAIHELIRCAGTQFDPHIVEVFVNLPGEIFSGPAVASLDHLRVQELEAAKAS